MENTIHSVTIPNKFFHCKILYIVKSSTVIKYNLHCEFYDYHVSDITCEQCSEGEPVFNPHEICQCKNYLKALYFWVMTRIDILLDRLMQLLNLAVASLFISFMANITATFTPNTDIDKVIIHLYVVWSNNLYIYKKY